ncbi:avidin/streptavidin family protein [Asticcacaulis sp.]|uniref:avidin/streptavidin family protein n=1 Tax=Asticcacaulis sp. TaxID=1872648 RepID=UPI002602C330|nr:avidin/streptavidin family protein [Asticcacaulis sp.]
MNLSGVWTNEYGSRMELWALDDGVFRGRYVSSTGSTGEYAVCGHAVAGAAGPERGKPLALAIAWHSLVPGPADPSWDWCSGLSGQISLRDGAPVMGLTHALVASSDFPGLAQAGTHIDRLTYRRIGDAGPPPALPSPAAAIDTPLTGTWREAEGAEIDLITASDAGFDRVRGQLRRSGRAMELRGFAGRGAVRSLALTGLLPGGEVMALAGTLPAGSDMLSMIDLTSHPTPPDSLYLQTRINGRRFARVMCSAD